MSNDTTSQQVQTHAGALPEAFVRQLSEIADLLDNTDTHTGSGIEITAIEFIDVQVAAGREIKRMIADHASGKPGQLLVERDAFIGVLASLTAAISLLEAGGKRAAPSNKMFDVMIEDYKKALDIGRTACFKSAPPESTAA